MTPLDVVTLGPASAGVRLWRASGMLRATVFLKATFSLLPDREASVSPPLPIERDDHSYDDSQSRSLRSAAETAPFLPSAGVILTGHAWAPPGAPVNALSARLALSGEGPLLDKTLHVFGDLTTPGGQAAPFQSMPLVYERAYGGPGVPANPVGVGGPGARRPNLVDPTNPHRPAGFGPIAPHWPLRRRLFAGLDLRAPDGPMDLPGDFDFRAFHAAPPDQQIPFLQGDEWILLDNLCPGRARVQTRLPRARGQARWYLVTSAGTSRPRDLRMFADTLVIDADRQLASVVWRGHFPIELPEVLPKLRIFAGLELPNVPIEWPERHAISGFGGPVGAASLHRTAPDHGAPSQGPALPFREGTGAPIVFVAHDETGGEPGDPRGMTGAIVRSKLDKPALPFPLKPDGPASQRFAGAMLPRLDDDDDETEDRLAMTGRLNLSQLGLPALPFRKDAPDAPPAGPFDDDDTTGLFMPGSMRPGGGLAGAAPLADEAPIAGAPWSHVPANPPPALSGIWNADQDATGIAIDLAALGFRAEPEPADAPLDQPISAAPMNARPMTGPPMPSAPMIDSFAIGAPKIRVSNIEVPMIGTSTIGTSTIGTSTIGASNTSAPVIAALLADAPSPLAPPPPAMFGATPASAPPTGDVAPALRKRAQVAIAAGSDLDGQDLSGADLSDLDLSGLSLQKCILRRANLRGARLKNAELAGADLTGADLTGADLTGASLPNACADRATLTDAVFADTDLTGASFVSAVAERTKFIRARGEGAVFRGANLRRADFTLGRFPKSVLTDADLRDAQAEQAHFSAARFVRADLTRTSFRKASLAKAVLAFAKLDGTDLRSADLDGANLHGAPRRRAKLVGATLTNIDETEPRELDA